MNQNVSKDLAAKLSDLTYLIGNLFFIWGLKRSHGKLWAVLLLSKEPQTALSLQKSLDVSKALISISIKDLLEIDAIKITGKNEGGVRLYKANDDIQSVISRVIELRERPLLKQIEETRRRLINFPSDDLRRQDLCEKQLVKLETIIASPHLLLDQISESSTWLGN